MKKILISLGLVALIFLGVFSSVVFLNAMKLNNVLENASDTEYQGDDNVYEYNQLLIDSKSESVLYYGKVLKYFYANSVEIEQSNLNDISTLLTNNSPGLNTFQKASVIQNLIAQTFNISVYGSSSDAEFFAEAFSKWLTTPDNLKNKSWEITNNFFVDIFPQLMKSGSLLNAKKELAEIGVNQYYANTANKTKYNLNSSAVSSNIDFKYNNKNFGYNSSNYTNEVLLNIQNSLNIGNLLSIRNDLSNKLSNWMNESYTKASDESEDKFKTFNQQHFKTFEQLDSVLVDSSIDRNGQSMLSYGLIYDTMNKTYQDSLPKRSSEIVKKWSDEYTNQLKLVTLDMYNYLYAILQDAHWVNEVIYAMIISPDYPLKDQASGVLAYTSTSYNNKSTIENYIVISGYSLLIKEYNENYKAQWFSSPAMFVTLVHEMGHAIDSFGSKTNEYRNRNSGENKDYKSLYKGEYFYKYNPSSKRFGLNNFYVIIGSAIVGGVVVVVCLYFLTRKRK